MAKATKKSGQPKARVLEDGTLMLFGVVGDDWFGFTAAEVVEDLHRLDNPDTLRVLINSPGGDVAEGLAIYHELATYPGTVEVEVVGVAASMASVIAMAGETVRVAKNAHMMIHDPWNVAVGNAEEMRRAADLLDRFGTTLSDIYAERTGKSEDEIKDLMAKNNGEGVWFDADAAVEFGLADEAMEDSDDEAFAKLDLGNLALVPAALAKQVREAKVRTAHKPEIDPADEGGTEDDDKGGAADGGSNQGDDMGQVRGTNPEVKAPEPKEPEPQAKHDDTKARKEGVKAERERQAELRRIAAASNMNAAWVDAQIEGGATAEQARELAINAMADRQDGQGGPSDLPGGVGVDRDERDRFVDGATAWILAKAGKTRDIEKHTGQKLDPGEFRGYRLLDLADHALELAGVRTRGNSPMERARMALFRSAPRANTAGMETTSDFPILLENALNKMLEAAYALAPTRWRDVAAQGSVSDFREHKRLRKGSIGRLQDKLQSGEFKHVHIGDGEAGVVKAETQGVMVGISRQAIVNDDVGAFISIMADLGQASARSIDIDLFDLLKLAGGHGPTIGPFRIDGELEAQAHPLFHVDRSNISQDPGPPSVDRFQEMRVLMAKQQDPNGEDFLDLRPAVWVGPVDLGGETKVVVEAEFDFAAESTAGTDGISNQFRKPNKVRDFVTTFVDTPRLEGTRYYLLADPAVAPVFEVVFLDGEANPVMETEERLEFDGVLWRVRHDYGVAGIDFRGAVTNEGVAP